MKLIIGGAYQGKLDYVLNNYNVNTIFNCKEDCVALDLDSDVIYGFEKFVLNQVKNGNDVLEIVNKNLKYLENKIIICDDISCGVVPISNETRQWREKLGQILVILSKNSEEVIRVFCGIGTKIK